MTRDGDTLIELINATRRLEQAKALVRQIEELTKLHYTNPLHLDAEWCEILQKGRQN